MISLMKWARMILSLQLSCADGIVHFVHSICRPKETSLAKTDNSGEIEWRVLVESEAGTVSFEEEKLRNLQKEGWEWRSCTIETHRMVHHLSRSRNTIHV